MIKQPTSLGCFLCGKDNPVGLKIHWLEDAEKKEVYTDVVIGENYRSYPGIVHGGIVATLLDETSGRAIFFDNEYANLMVTLKLEVVYKKPTPTNTKVRVVGRVVRPGKTRAVVEAEIILPDGSVSAKASAIVMRPPADVLMNDAAESAEWERTSPKK